MVVSGMGRLMVFSLFGTVLLAGCNPPYNPAPNVQMLTPPGAIMTLPSGTTQVNLGNYRTTFNSWQRQGGHTRVRIASALVCPKCGTAVTIEAYAWANGYGPNRVPPVGKQVLVGYLKNTGPYATEMYSLKGNGDAEYYLFATNVGGLIGWEMREVGPGTTGTMPINSHGMYTSCGHGRPTRNEADFRRCNYESKRVDGVISLASADGWKDLVARALRAVKAPPLDEDPAWLSCTGGCCTINAI